MIKIVIVFNMYLSH